jgi:hypothetical protein
MLWLIMAWVSLLLSMLIFLSSTWLAVNLTQIPFAFAQADFLTAVTSSTPPPTARSIEQFRQIKRGMSMAKLKAICGEPDADIGSGLNIYVYNLSDGSSVIIGGGSTILYINYSKPVKKIKPIDRIPLLATAQKFYQWNIESAVVGIPTGQQLLPIQNLLDPKLVKYLEQAKSIETCLIQSAPKDIKPAIFEGSVFVDNYEGVSKVKALSLSGQGDTATVTATLEYTDRKQTSTSISVSELVLKKKADRWLIEDIRLSRQRQITEYTPSIPKTLTNILAGYIRQYQDACKS